VGKEDTGDCELARQTFNERVIYRKKHREGSVFCMDEGKEDEKEGG